MEKLKHILTSIALWVFTAFCLIMAIGVPFGIGTILLILAAVMATPIAPVRKIWETLLNLRPQEKKKLFESKKKQAARRKTTAKTTKFLIIAIVFLFGLVFGMAAMETAEPTHSTEGSTVTSTPEIDEPSSTSPDNAGEQKEPDESITPNPSEEPSTPHETTAPADPSEPEKEPSSDPVATPPVNSSFSIHFIDVGQADAALIECDGHYMLIDGGNKADSNAIYSVLKKASVPKLDIVVGTHAHEDHIGGLPGAYNYTTADLTLCPVKNYNSNAFEDFAKYANQKGGGITVPAVGNTYALGSATVTILGVNGGSDANDTSIVLRIDYGKTSFLFTGDAERDAEQAILNSGADLSTTVLKVGHHGSDTSTGYVFLREIMPQYAVISVGSDNSYGHPTEATLSRLRDADVKTFRTDLQGDIYCTSDGKTVSFSVDRNKDVDVFGSAGSNSTQEEPKESEPIISETEPEPEDDPEPVGIDYVGNKDSKKFHYAWCSSVDRMKESNKYYYTGTRDEMIAKGYVPCKNCNP